MHASQHHPLEQALPVELVGSGHGWFTRYQSYPVFSRAWGLGRWRLTGTMLLLLVGLLSLTIFFDTDGLSSAERQGLIRNTAVNLLGIVSPLLLGPALACWVRRRGWQDKTEWQALVLTMLCMAGIGAALSLWVPHHRGLLTFVATNPETPDVNLNYSVVDLARVCMDSMITFWAGGGFGLLTWQQQGGGLTRLQQQRALQQARREANEAELRLSVLAAQVEPHFLFNTLAGVRSAIATDPVRASAMIDQLVAYLHASIPKLRSDGALQAELGEQFELVRAYLALMSARMPRLHFSLEMTPGLEWARCPPLMLISLVENAVKHGVEPKPGPAHIAVRARRLQDQRLEISVEDDGVGFQASSDAGGLGLANIRERLQGLFGGRAELILRAGPQGGVLAQLLLPPSEPAPEVLKP